MNRTFLSLFILFAGVLPSQRGEAATLKEWTWKLQGLWEAKCSRVVVEVYEIVLPAEIVADFDRLDEARLAKKGKLAPDEFPPSLKGFSDTDQWTIEFLLSSVQTLDTEGKLMFQRRDSPKWNRRLKTQTSHNLRLEAEQTPIVQSGPGDLFRDSVSLLRQLEGVHITRIAHTLRVNQSNTRHYHSLRRPMSLSYEKGEFRWQLEPPDEEESRLPMNRQSSFASTAHETASGDQIITVVAAETVIRRAALSVAGFDILMSTLLGLLLWRWALERKLVVVWIGIYLFVALFSTWSVWFPADPFLKLHPKIFSYLLMVRVLVLIPFYLVLAFPYRDRRLKRGLIAGAGGLACAMLFSLWVHGQKAEATTGLYTNRYVVPPTFLRIARPTGEPSGRLRGGVNSPPQSKRPTAMDVFRDAGIIVNSAKYDPATSQLTVKAELKTMSLVEFYVDSLRSGVEIQIYVVPKHLHLSQEDFAKLKLGERSDHPFSDVSPDIEAIEHITGKTFAPRPSLMMRLGQNTEMVLETASMIWSPILRPDAKVLYFGATQLVSGSDKVSSVTIPHENTEPELIVALKRESEPFLLVFPNEETNTLDLFVIKLELMDPAGMPFSASYH